MRSRVAIVVVAALALGLAVVAGSSASPAPPKLWKACPTGAGAGQCKIARGLATDPNTNDVYVTDQNPTNDRVERFSAWGQFELAWGWGVRDGSLELQSCGPSADPPIDDCFPEHPRGAGVGQFNTPAGIAVDELGDVYVADINNHRIQKFALSPGTEGEDIAFVWMAGGEVNQTRVQEREEQEANLEPVTVTEAQENLCTEASGDVCQAGTTGSGAGQFEAWSATEMIDADRPGPGEAIYVGDKDRIQKLGRDGHYIESIEGAVAGKTVQSLAVDPSGNVFTAFAGEANVAKLDPTGAVLCTATVPNPRSVASDEEGNLYAVNLAASPATPEVLEFNPDCSRNEVVPYGADELSVPAAAPNPGIATGSACYDTGRRGIYLGNADSNNSFIRAYGPPPDDRSLCPTPPKDPSIVEQAGVGAPSADTVSLGAQINPHFWEDTTYYVQYGACPVGGCAEGQRLCAEGGCTSQQPAVPADLGGNADLAVATAAVAISGLELETEYRYRFVAVSSGGGPSYGIDPDGEEGPQQASEAEGLEGSFATFPKPCDPAPCPLPDSRAYEQVSPNAKAGYDVDPAFALARPDGGAVIYGSPGAFASPRAGGTGNTYLATRGANWQSRALEPPLSPLYGSFSPPVLGVSGDFSKQLVFTNAELTPEAKAVGEDPTVLHIYVHDSATDSYQYVATAHGDGTDPINSITDFQAYAGAADDGSHFYFSLRLPLDSTPAPSGGAVTKLYGFDTASGELSYLGIPPGGGEPDPAGSFAAGAGAVALPPDSVSYHPVSADGSRVYWTHTGSGPIYLREGGTTTTLVSERESDSSAQSATLWGTSKDGGAAFLTSAGKLTANASPSGTDLYRYDADTDELTDLTPTGSGAGVASVLGVSEDGTYAYFTATGNLAGGAEGSNPKLYAWHDGSLRLIGELGSPLVGTAATELWRVSPNGHYLGFLFAGRIAGPHEAQPYPFRQAYLYDYQQDTLACASCGPGGYASGDVNLHQGGRKAFPTGSLHSYEAGLTRNVSNQGQLFFQSPDRLLLEDTNAKQDVYEYESGKVHLLSSGQSTEDSFFTDASASGNDAFIATRESLLNQDKGELIDLYDVRVGGGIPGQDDPDPIPCDPELNCQPQVPAPAPLPDPITPALIGPPNPAPPHCKGKTRLRGGRCRKPKKHRKHKHKHHRKHGGRR